MMTPTAPTTSLPSPAKLPWETPLCQPLDTAEGTEKLYIRPSESSPNSGPPS